MTRVFLDQNLCRGYGLCVGLHPDVFAMPPGSPVAVLARDVLDDEDLDDVQQAIRACPAQAISLVEVSR